MTNQFQQYQDLNRDKKREARGDGERLAKKPDPNSNYGESADSTL